MKLLSSFKVILILSFFFYIGSFQGLTPPDIVWKEKRFRYSSEYVVLTCNVTGKTPTYEWLVNGKKAHKGIELQEDGRIVKVNIRMTEGYFQCQAENGLGVALSDRVLVGRKMIPEDELRPEVISVKEGDYKDLKCKNRNDWIPFPEVIWKKDGKKIVYDSRIQADDQGTLHISYILKDDDSDLVKDYTCTLDDKVTTRITTQITLKVEGLSMGDHEVILRDKTKSPLTGIRGSSITMRCIFSGAKDINVEWLNPIGRKVQGNQIIPGPGSSITIKDLQNTDAGKYKCRANDKEEIIEVIVNDVPVFLTENDGPKNTYATTGSSAQFVCNATSNPAPNIQWFKNGKALNLDGTLEDKMGISTDYKVLTISRLCRECGMDAVFQCNASNAFGYVYKNAFLKIYDATIIFVKPVDVEFEENKNVTFTCEAKTDVDTPVNYEWQFNDKAVHIGSIKTKQKELFLNTDVLKASNIEFVGKWTCIASNGYSTDKAEASLSFKINPAFAQWWILVLVLLIILLLALIIGCVCNTIYKNRGSVYPVDEIEHKNGNDPEKELLEYGFHDYQRDVTISTSGTLRSQRSMGSTNSLARA